MVGEKQKKNIKTYYTIVKNIKISIKQNNWSEKRQMKNNCV